MATVPLLLEYEDVLKRPEQRAISGVSLADLDGYLSELTALMEPVSVHLLWRPQLRDPGDELVLEAAYQRTRRRARYPQRPRFHGRGPRFGVRVLRPADLLSELRR